MRFRVAKHLPDGAFSAGTSARAAKKLELLLCHASSTAFKSIVSTTMIIRRTLALMLTRWYQCLIGVHLRQSKSPFNLES